MLSDDYYGLNQYETAELLEEEQTIQSQLCQSHDPVGMDVEHEDQSQEKREDLSEYLNMEMELWAFAESDFKTFCQISLWYSRNTPNTK